MRANSNPPRNGEGDRAAQSRGGGVPPTVLRAPIKDVRQAREFRRKMTLPEVVLWEALRARPGGFKFRRQIPLVGYTLDFCCLSSRVAVEVDGEVHGRGDQPGKDERRDERLAGLGFATLRIPATIVLRDLDSAVTAIVALCGERDPSTTAQGRGGPPPRAGED